MAPPDSDPAKPFVSHSYMLHIPHIPHMSHVPHLKLTSTHLRPALRYSLLFFVIINVIISTIYALYPYNISTIPDYLREIFTEKMIYVYISSAIGLLMIMRLIISLYEVVIKSFRKLIIKLIASYFATIYSFSMIYIYLDRANMSHFSIKQMDFVTSIYFSTICISTVGFGDIVPTTSLAKLIVSGEILFGIAFNIFAFSVVSSLAFQKIKLEPPA